MIVGEKQGEEKLAKGVDTSRRMECERRWDFRTKCAGGRSDEWKKREGKCKRLEKRRGVFVAFGRPQAREKRREEPHSDQAYSV